MKVQEIQLNLPGRLGGVTVLDGRNRDGSCDEAPGEAENERSEQIQKQQQERVSQELARLKEARGALGVAMTKFQEIQRKLLTEAEPQMIDLVLELLQKILAQEVQLGKYEIAPIVQEALEHVDTYEKIIVHLNEEDYQAFLLTQDSDVSSRQDSVEFVSDPNIGRAECVLETQSGRIHSRLEDKVSEITKLIKGTPH